MRDSESTFKVAADAALMLAKSTVVLNQADFERAGNMRKEIKATIKNISDYWRPKKDQANQLHKSLVQAEKEMIDPLNQADRLIDQRMGDFRREIERQRQEAERERKRIEAEALAAAMETQRLLNEAAQKDEMDEDDVEILMLAQREADLRANAVIETPEIASAKMQGISVRRTWKAKIIDESAVPVSVAGVMIRPIDKIALNKLASISKGSFDCPGVEFYQEESTQVRS